MSIALTNQDKQILRTAAYGAVSLLAAAGAAGGSPHKIATDGSIALASATGAIGHVLADKSTGVKLTGNSVAAMADQILPALTAAMSLLHRLDPAEANNFRHIVRLDGIDQREHLVERPIGLAIELHTRRAIHARRHALERQRHLPLELRLAHRDLLLWEAVARDEC